MPAFEPVKNMLPMIKKNIENMNENLERWQSIEDNSESFSLPKSRSNENKPSVLDSQIREIIQEADEEDEKHIDEAKTVRLDHTMSDYERE